MQMTNVEVITCATLLGPIPKEWIDDYGNDEWRKSPWNKNNLEFLKHWEMVTTKQNDDTTYGKESVKLTPFGRTVWKYIKYSTLDELKNIANRWDAGLSGMPLYKYHEIDIRRLEEISLYDNSFKRNLDESCIPDLAIVMGNRIPNEIQYAYLQLTRSHTDKQLVYLENKGGISNTLINQYCLGFNASWYNNEWRTLYATLSTWESIRTTYRASYIKKMELLNTNFSSKHQLRLFLKIMEYLKFVVIKPDILKSTLTKRGKWFMTLAEWQVEQCPDENIVEWDMNYGKK